MQLYSRGSCVIREWSQHTAAALQCMICHFHSCGAGQQLANISKARSPRAQIHDWMPDPAVALALLQITGGGCSMLKGGMTITSFSVLKMQPADASGRCCDAFGAQKGLEHRFCCLASAFCILQLQSKADEVLLHNWSPKPSRSISGKW